MNVVVANAKCSVEGESPTFADAKIGTVRRRGPLRAAVEWCVWLLLAAAAMETWFVAGLAVPWRVVGGSMAETLLGTHRNVACADCGRQFACSADQSPAPPRAVCPNCGYAANDVQSPPDLDGDRLLVDRTAFSLRPPRRWEIVALRHPQRADEILVKRVVGLPGESIEIRNGDVYADGEIQRKNLAEQHALAILVYDAGCRPALEPTPPPRWRAERRETGWSSAGGCFSHTTGVKTGPVDWLVYHHVRRLAGGSTVESPVTDVCGYDQSQPRREEDVHAVADLLLSFWLEPAGNGTFFVRADDGVETFEVRLHFLGKGPDTWQYEAFRGNEAIPGASGSVRHADRRFVEVSLIDQQFLLALDGQTLVAWPYQRPTAASPPSTPLAIGAEGRLETTVRELRVYRDVYYTQPIGSGVKGDSPIFAETKIGTVPFARTKIGTVPSKIGTIPVATAGEPTRLADDEYFVLGDNSPISDDSRCWPDRGAVSDKLLIGKPLAAIPSIEAAPWRGWRFQVPNLRRIRYIH